MPPNTLYVRGDQNVTHGRSFVTALDRLAEATDALGFDTVDYGFMPQVRAADGRYHAPTIVARNLPQRWRRGWTPFLREDPLLYGAYPRTLPLDWQEIEHAAWLTPLQRKAFDFLRALGICNGVTVPIHLPDNAFAFVTVACRDKEGTWRAQKKQVLDRLFVLAHDFHAEHGGRTSAPLRQPPNCCLSARERVVLEHAAAGLSAPEIALRIKRSVETVRAQRKSAMRKLNARTTAQAVARAVDAAIIEFNPAG